MVGDPRRPRTPAVALAIALGLAACCAGGDAAACTADSGEDEACALQVPSKLHSDLGGPQLPPFRNDLSLFDIKADPSETTNLAAAEERTARRLLAALYAATDETRVPEYPTYSTQAGLPDDVIAYLITQGGLMPWKEWKAGKSKPPVPQDPKRPWYVKPRRDAPNIVYILIDDWGWNDPGFLSTYANFTMPNIGKLKDNGVFLDRYYTNAACSPSRAMLQTGRFAHRIGVQRFPPLPTLNLDETTWAQELRSVGYHTAVVGKWHQGYESWLQMPTYRGYDEFFGYLGDSVNWFSHLSMQTKYNPKIPDLVDGEQPAKERNDGEHITSLLSRKAAGIIRRHAAERPKQPLFLYYAEMAVHNDQHGYNTTQRAKDYCRVAVINKTNPYNMSNQPPPVGDHEISYCGLQVMLDEAIGTVMTALQDSGLMKNTLVVVAGDNGGLSERIGGNVIRNGFIGANYPLIGSKVDQAEGGFRQHAIVYGPPCLIQKHRRGSTYSGLVHITDWLPTFMGLAAHGWRGPLSGYAVDGRDAWRAIASGAPSPWKGRPLIVNWSPYMDSSGAFHPTFTNGTRGAVLEEGWGPHGGLRKLIVGPVTELGSRLGLANANERDLFGPPRVLFELNGVLPRPTWGCSFHD